MHDYFPQLVFLWEKWMIVASRQFFFVPWKYLGSTDYQEKALEDSVIGLLILLDPNTLAGFGVDIALLYLWTSKPNCTLRCKVSKETLKLLPINFTGSKCWQGYVNLSWFVARNFFYSTGSTFASLFMIRDDLKDTLFLILIAK